MGKPKKANVATIKNVSLEKQITDGKVLKAKSKEKVKLRAEESPVGTSLIDIIPYLIQVLY